MDIDIRVKELYSKGTTFIETLNVKLRDGIDIVDIFFIIKNLIYIAEDTINIPKQGEIKHKIVVNLWKQADEKYDIIEYLLKFIPTIKIKIWLFKITIKPKDISNIIVLIIDKLVIPSLVELYNRMGWKK